MKFKDIAKELSSKDVSFVSGRDAGQVIGWADSGNYALNWAISNKFNGGYPLGHVVELSGPEGSGKSLLVARAISEFQKAFPSSMAFLDDTESAFNTEWAEEALGVDVDRLNVTGSVTVEDHFKAVMAIIERVKKENPVPPTLIALDSLALLTDDHELENEFAKDRVGGRAKEIRKLFRLTRPQLRGCPILYMITNHETDKIGSFFGGTTTTGGSGPRYQSSVRISLNSPKKIKQGTEIRGILVEAQVNKNRLTNPYRKVTLALPFYRPISRYSGLIPVLLDLNLIDVSGRTIVYNEEDTKVFSQKTNPIKQDIAAQELVEKYPDLLVEADKAIANLREADDDFTVEDE